MFYKQFKTLFSWLFNSLGNLFSLLGILLTIYFSIFYVPTYVKNVEVEKINKANEELIETIQEIVYNELEIDIDDINTLIDGKDIKYNIKYSYTVNQLLIQTQEDFIENKFIPLEERKLLVERIDDIRSNIKEETSAEKEGIFITDIIALILTFVGITISALGSVSVLVKNKNARELEINSKVNEEVSSISGHVMAAYDFEKKVGEVLKEMELRYDYSASDRGDNKFDYIIYNEKDEKSIVEVKYYLRNNKISQDIIRRLYHNAKLHDNINRIILISNVELTRSAQLYAEDVIGKGDIKFVHILATSKEEIESGLKNNK